MPSYYHIILANKTKARIGRFQRDGVPQSTTYYPDLFGSKSEDRIFHSSPAKQFGLVAGSRKEANGVPRRIPPTELQSVKRAHPADHSLSPHQSHTADDFSSPIHKRRALCLNEALPSSVNGSGHVSQTSTRGHWGSRFHSKSSVPRSPEEFKAFTTESVHYNVELAPRKI